MATEKTVLEAFEERKLQQNSYWMAFKDKLETIEKTYGISKSDIAQGLGVSRQSLYNFVKKPKNGIRIERASIVQLFDYIRFEQSDSLKPGDEFVKKRRELSKAALNEWLQEAGYAPESEGKTAIAQDTFKTEDHQIKRVVYRLTSKWVPDDSTKNYLVNNFLDQVLDQSRLSESYYADSIKYLDRDFDDEERQDISRKQTKQKNKDDGYDALSFSEAVLYDDSTEGKDVVKKYERALKALSHSGKYEFVRAELFELYQSILEHHYLGKESAAKVQTIDCRFRSLTFNLFERSLYKKRIYDRDRALDSIMRSASEVAEREIRGLGSSLDTKSQSDIEGKGKKTDDGYEYINTNPILETVIRCQLKVLDIDSGEHEYGPTFSVRYSSNATHVANLLLALKNGLCYPLDITNFFMRATGRTEKSLARVSMTLAKPKSKESSHQDKRVEEYAGWWVTSDTLTGIQKATTDAFVRWLSDRPFPQESQYITKYLKLCVQISEVRYSLSQARRALYEHTPAVKPNQSQTLRSFIKKKIIDEVEHIQQDAYYSEIFNEEDFAIHKRMLKNILEAAKILFNRTSLIESEARTEDKVRYRENELRAIIDESYGESDPFSHIIRLYAIACEMNHKFIVGDQSFLLAKQWYDNPRYSVEAAVKDAVAYVDSCGGVIELDTYLSMSDVYGTVGFMGFYFGDSQDQLQDALKNLLKGAHFALKTKFRKRAAQWLSYASRVCTRQGKLDRADYLLDLVTGITDDAVLEEIETKLAESEIDVDSKIVNNDEPEEFTRMLTEAQGWDDVSWLLAYGECLLKKGEAHKAFGCFFTALRTAILLKFFRVIADCLYNLHRAAQALADWSENAERTDLMEKHREIYEIIKISSSFLWALIPDNQSKRDKTQQEKLRDKLGTLISRYLGEIDAFEEGLENDKNPTEERDKLRKEFMSTYEHVAKESRTIAIEFWNSWRANTAIVHPVVQAIEKGEFLADVRN